MGRRDRGKKIYRQMYGKLEKLTERLLAKLHPSKLGEYNLLPSIVTLRFPKCVKFNFGK